MQLVLFNMVGGIGQKADADIVVGLNALQNLLVFILEPFQNFRIGRDFERMLRLQEVVAFAFRKNFVQLPLDFDAHAGGGFHKATAFAVRAVVECGAFQRFVFTLSRHFQKPQRGDWIGACAGAIFRKMILQRLVNKLLVFLVRHVDQIENDETADVAQTNLPCDFRDGFKIRGENRFRLVFARFVLAGIDVDGDERLRFVNTDVSAAWQVDLAVVNSVDLLI